MKKQRGVLLGITLLLSAGMPMVLTSCEEIERDYELDVRGREESEEVLSDFFLKTYEHDNQTVSVVGDADNRFVENIDGDRDYVRYEEGYETWSFVDEDDYVFASKGEEGSFYMFGEEPYGIGRYVYKNYLDLVFGFTEEEAARFAYHTSVKKTGKNASLRFRIGIGFDEIIILANAKNGLVERAVMTFWQTAYARESIMIFDISYGNAKVNNPDLSGWELYSGEISRQA